MENLPHFGIVELLIDLLGGKPKEFMAVVVDPDFIFLTVENVLAAVVIRLDGKGFFILVKRNFVVVDHDLEIMAGNALLHDDFTEGVDGLAGIKDIINQKNLVSASKEFG